MLKEKEIKIGELYAWDATRGVTPNVGCYLFKLIKFSKKENFIICTIESLDGYIIDEVSSEYLIPQNRALKRLKILENINIDELDSLEKYKYKKEYKYLKEFEKSLANFIF